MTTSIKRAAIATLGAFVLGGAIISAPTASAAGWPFETCEQRDYERPYNYYKYDHSEGKINWYKVHGEWASCAM